MKSVEFSQLNKNPFFKSSFAGLLLAGSFPPFSIPILIIPAFYLLFQLAEQSDSGKQLAYWSYPTFFLWNLISTYWLMYATFAGGLAAISANAVLMTIPLSLIRRALKSKVHFEIKSLIIATIWTSYEFLHFRWDLAWPWLSLGNAFGEYPFLVQFIEITGQLGITFLIVFISAISFFMANSRKLYQKLKLSYLKLFLGIKYTFPNGSQIPLLGYLVILLLNIGIINMVLFNRAISKTDENSVEIVVVQPNYDSYITDSGFISMSEAMENLLQLADSARTAETKLILFPENSIQPLISKFHYFSRQMADSAHRWNVTLVSGLNEYVTYSKNPPKVYRGNHNNSPFDIFNSSFIWESNGSITPYRKYNLVPIVERFPFIDEIAYLDVFNWVNWGKFAGFAQGQQVVNANFEGGKSSVLICYDSVFPDWSRRYVKSGATMIGIITNDGWWGDSPGHEQHFSFGRLRAIETRREIARSANNGISGFISSTGKIIQRSNYWERTYLREKVPQHTEITIYTRFGDWIGWISLIGTVGFFFFFKNKH